MPALCCSMSSHTASRFSLHSHATSRQSLLCSTVCALFNLIWPSPPQAALGCATEAQESRQGGWSLPGGSRWLRAAGFSGAKEQRFAYKDGVKCLQGQWSFSAYKKSITVQWWYNQEILCLLAITWALCACQSTQGRKRPVQISEREGILRAENAFTVQSYIWQEAIRFLFWQIWQSLVAGRQGRKKNPQPFALR